MKIKKIGVALVAALALSAVTAGAAQASSPGHWLVNGNILGAGVTKSVEAHKTSTETKLELSAPSLGVKLTATGISCVECTIYNDGTAHSAGKLKFTGVTVDEPEGCTVASELTTAELTDEVIMSGTGAEEHTYDLFYPQVEGGTFITIRLSECAIAGKYKVTGTVAGKSTNETGVESGAQTLTFNGTNTAGASLALGGKEAFLMGEVENSLVGGGEFSAVGT
jgi:hypothetical protein